jgi:hypothetical protein
MKCCFKDCQRQGEAIQEFDLNVCEECLEELERLILVKYREMQEEEDRLLYNNVTTSRGIN